ncbi:MAG: hydrogenase expression/formation protein HypE [Candidatus Geothermincolia bacterium]
MPERFVTMAHGGGGTRMQELLRDLVFPALGGSLDAAEDAACIEVAGGRLAFTTDSFVVKPLFFSGGDIGKLAVCGTVNDLAMVGAEPLYLTLGFILEEGLDLFDLEKIIASVAEAADSAGVRVVAGDTKVVERGKADGLYVNTSGVGTIPDGVDISIAGAGPGCALIVNGFIGDHGIAVLKDRGEFSFDVSLCSDCAALNGLVTRMLAAGTVCALRDPTRGGLAAALKEMSSASGLAFDIEEDAIPVREEVRAICEVLGLDPLYVANEGKLLAAVPAKDVEPVLEAMKADPLGAESRVIGNAVQGKRGRVTLTGSLGQSRLLRMPSGEQLPRIC